MTPAVVTPLTECRRTQYESWLQTVPDSMVYYSSPFLRFLSQAVGGEAHVLLATRKGCVVGALPYLSLQVRGLGTVVNSLPWYGSHGGCMLADREDDAARRALLTEFRTAAERPNLIAATVIIPPQEHHAQATYEEILAPQAIDERIGQISELPAAADDLPRTLATQLRQKTRNLVRKACRQGFVETVTDEDWAWQFLFDTHEQNMAAIGGRAKPRAHFAALRKHIPHDRLRLSVAMLGTTPTAAMLCIGFASTVEYITPVILHEYRSMQPLSFLIWQAMLAASRAGYRRWNWGGTWHSQVSLHHFKAGWGARDHRYCYFVMLGQGGLDSLRKRRNEIASEFPYYYVYPFGQLERDTAQQA